MTTYEKKSTLVACMYHVANINDKVSFCKTFNSDLKELELFLKSSDEIIPASWLKVMFALNISKKDARLLYALVEMVQGTTHEPIYFHDPSRSESHRPEYTGPVNADTYQGPLKRAAASKNTEENVVVSQSSKKTDTRVTKAKKVNRTNSKKRNRLNNSVRTLQLKTPDFPTKQRLKELIKVSLMCSMKENACHRDLFETHLLILVPSAKSLRIRNDQVIFFDSFGDEKSRIDISDVVFS